MAQFVKSLFGRRDIIYFKFPKEDDETKLFYAGLYKKAGLLFRTVTAEARVSLKKGLKIKQVSSDILTGYGSATMGTYVGVEAGANLAELEASIFKLNLGYGVGTGMGIQDGSVVVKFLGTGIKLGRKIGVSVLGSAFELDFGKLLKNAWDRWRFRVKAVVDRVRQAVNIVKWIKEAVGLIKEAVELIKGFYKEAVELIKEYAKEAVELIKEPS